MTTVNTMNRTATNHSTMNTANVFTQLVREINRGVYRASARLEELDAHPIAGAAYIDNAWSMSDEARRTLTAEGVRATAAAHGRLYADGALVHIEPSELLAMVEGLTANPWHVGPMREAVMTGVNYWVTEYFGLPEVAEILRDDDYVNPVHSGRAMRAAAFIARANDADMVAAVLASGR